MDFVLPIFPAMKMKFNLKVPMHKNLIISKNFLLANMKAFNRLLNSRDVSFQSVRNLGKKCE